MKKIGIIILMIVFAITVSFVGCKKEVAPATKEEPAEEEVEEMAPAEEEEVVEEEEKLPVKIAGIWNTTGQQKSGGDLVANGVMLAVKQVNESGGILGGRMIELSIYDEGMSADVTSASVKKAINDGNVAIVGGNDATAIFKIQQLARDEGIPFSIALGSNKKILDPDMFYYYGTIHPTLYPEVSEIGLCRWFVDQGYKSMVFVSYDLQWGHDYETVFRKAFDKPDSPIEILDVLYFPVDQPTVELEITKAIGLNPDFIYAGFWSSSAEVSFLETTHRLGYEGGRCFPPDSMQPSAVEATPEAANGAVCTTTYLPNLSPESKAFDEAFMAEYGHIAPGASTMSYEAAMILFLGMDKAGTDSDLKKIADGMHSVDWVSPRGFKLEILPNGQVACDSVWIAEARDGEIVFLDEQEILPEDW